jgi:hypothetical protein
MNTLKLVANKLLLPVAVTAGLYIVVSGLPVVVGGAIFGGMFTTTSEFGIGTCSGHYCRYTDVFLYCSIDDVCIDFDSGLLEQTDYVIREFLLDDNGIPKLRTELADSIASQLGAGGHHVSRLYIGPFVLVNPGSVDIINALPGAEELATHIQPVFNGVVFKDYELSVSERRAYELMAEMFNVVVDVGVFSSIEWCGQSLSDGRGSFATHAQCGQLHALLGCPNPVRGFHDIYTCTNCCSRKCGGHITASASCPNSCLNRSNPDFACNEVAHPLLCNTPERQATCPDINTGGACLGHVTRGTCPPERIEICTNKNSRGNCRGTCIAISSVCSARCVNRPSPSVACNVREHTTLCSSDSCREAVFDACVGFENCGSHSVLAAEFFFGGIDSLMAAYFIYPIADAEGDPGRSAELRELRDFQDITELIREIVFDEFAHTLIFGVGGPGGGFGGGSGVGVEVFTDALVSPFHHFWQWDGYWADMRYGPPGASTYARGGCYPTSYAMIISSLTGRIVYPDQVGSYVTSIGMRGTSGGTMHGATEPTMRNWGLTATHIGSNSAAVTSALSRGQLIFFSVGNQPTATFTNGGHGLVMRGLTGDGLVIIACSARRSVNNHAFDLGFVLQHARTGNVWAIRR